MNIIGRNHTTLRPVFVIHKLTQVENIPKLESLDSKKKKKKKKINVIKGEKKLI